MLSNSNSEYHIVPRGRSSLGDAKTHKLVLTTTSLRNVVLATGSDAVYYEVRTPHWEWHRTRVARLDAAHGARTFGVVAEILNGHPPGDRQGREEDAKRAMALRMYGQGEYRAADEFLHIVEGSAGRSAEKEKEKENVHENGKGKAGAFTAWFRVKDCRKFTWHADWKQLELWQDDRNDRPVAAFHREERYMNVLRMSQYPYLEVLSDPVVIESLDYLIS